MTIIKPLRGKTPQYPSNCWFAETATVIGNVTMGNDCTVWYNAVIRGDVHYIKLGNKVNVQDGACIHCTYEKYPTVIGNNVSIGHHAIVHGCTIEDNVLIGMGAIVMDNCVIEKNSIVAAGAIVSEGTRVPSGTIYAGVPARLLKEVSEEHFKSINERIANNYVKYASWYQEEENKTNN
jgi:carbonic anhydrase/acetyltransferase-like protein (isoleucine patch superfamily)